MSFCCAATKDQQSVITTIKTTPQLTDTSFDMLNKGLRLARLKRFDKPLATFVGTGRCVVGR